jgi:hypothetical protein
LLSTGNIFGSFIQVLLLGARPSSSSRTCEEEIEKSHPVFSLKENNFDPYKSETIAQKKPTLVFICSNIFSLSCFLHSFQSPPRLTRMKVDIRHHLLSLSLSPFAKVSQNNKLSAFPPF